MAQGKRREKLAHQLILEALEQNSLDMGGFAVTDALLDVLEEMKISKDNFPEITKELKRFKEELAFTESQFERINALIAELSQ